MSKTDDDYDDYSFGHTMIGASRVARPDGTGGRGDRGTWWVVQRRELHSCTTRSQLDDTRMIRTAARLFLPFDSIARRVWLVGAGTNEFPKAITHSTYCLHAP